MKHILARQKITDKEVKIFLDETRSEMESLKSRIKPNDPNAEAVMEDADNLYTICKTISEKIGKSIALTSEEREDLKKLLLGVKQSIKRGIIEGVSTGIDDYIRQLE